MIDAFRKSYLTVPVFATRAYGQLEALDGDEYRMRSVAGSKELIEEIVPLAALLKHLEIPDRRLRCRFVGGDSDHDAKIRIAGPEVDRGFLEPSYFVEITTAISPIDYLEREALTRNGHVFAGGDIRRMGSGKGAPIVSRATAVDGEAAVLNAISWVKQRLEAKSAKVHPRPCMLAVNVEPERVLGLAEWAMLAAALHGAVDRGRFDLAYVVHWRSNMVFPI